MGWNTFRAKFIWTKCWKPFFTLFIPLALSVIFLWKGVTLKTKYDNKKAGKRIDPPQWKQCRAAYIVILMGCYWVTECLPLAVTALCPLFLLPFLEIADSDKVASQYLGNSVLLLTAGCIVAQSFEYSNLHTRIALKVACIVGAKVPILLAGFMLTAMFLSMWMNNTSTTSMMVPILAVIMDEFEAGAKESAKLAAVLAQEKADVIENQLKAQRSIASEKSESDIKPDSEPTENLSLDAAAGSSEIQKSDKDEKDEKRSHTSALSEKEIEKIKEKSLKEARNLKIMFLLGAAWASNIGGTGIITGTATNVIAKDAMDTLIKESDLKDPKKCKEKAEITFVNWFIYAVAPMLVATIVTWVILLLWFTGIPSFCKCRKMTPQEKKLKAEKAKVTGNVERAILAKYNQLGKISLHEVLVLILFVLLAAFWILGKIGTGGEGKWNGWHYHFTYKNKIGGGNTVYANATMPALLICILLMIIPKDKKYYKDFANGGLAHGLRDPLLPWNEIEQKVPWGPLILIGGGLSISVAIKDSGLGEAIGLFLQSPYFQKLSKEAFLVVILVVVSLLTIIASNTATASILTPVMIELSRTKNIHPLYLVLPATVSASFAFILPISTPPNAIVMDKSDMKQKEMAQPGIIVTIVCNVLLYAVAHSYGELVFGFNKYDDWCGKKA